MPDRAIAGFLVVNGLANWLPWIVVQRCTFLYHGMAALVFAIMAIAWLCDRWLAHPRWWPFGAIVVASILGAFLFWLPVYLGLPLSPDAWALRFWLPSWI
jgi:dolichyl-phosphate-mannose--protein O-mannosyl transferase